MKTSALLLFAHGSSDPAWAKPFERIRDAVTQASPERAVALAYLERMSPGFDEAVAALVEQGIREVVVAPLFLAPGGHVRSDLPALIAAAAARHGIAIRALASLGESPDIIDAIATWAIRGAES
jgi:sirohydrochlorin cobaltochelatase